MSNKLNPKITVHSEIVIIDMNYGDGRLNKGIGHLVEIDDYIFCFIPYAFDGEPILNVTEISTGARVYKIPTMMVHGLANTKRGVLKAYEFVAKKIYRERIVLDKFSEKFEEAKKMTIDWHGSLLNQSVVEDLRNGEMK